MPIMPMIMMTVGALAALLLVFVAFSGPSTSKALSRRLSSAKDRHASSASASIEAQMRKAISARQTTKMDSVASQILPNPALLKQRIGRTGKAWTLGQYGVASLGLAIGTAMLAMLQGLPWALSVLIGVMLGLAIPHMTISYLIKKRINAFTARFPDAIELLVRGLRAGLPISETLNVVAKEIPGPVGEEFSTVADKIRIGRTMEAALQDVADKLNTPEFQFFVITLAIQRETGGNLAETLSNLADVLRKRAQMKLKIKAMSSESKASAYIVGSLPFLVFALIYVQSPGYMGQFFTDQRLIIAGLGGLTWMGIGSAIMAKMVSFEI
ncbi:type II secretion system F family protein [Sphingomonas colocasiae]|uniref:Type II secretion system F family protein n=1 Tax=Sphingomonas colocasiae TaxID=1848973 RepID=A0ABS7PNA8_9SPHN|nr:type II secretion system F family protein [Sphingomonas colocasiae]MBY8822756.1 type II secretion system F family protein [Sphingomonas colocasiae]